MSAFLLLLALMDDQSKPVLKESIVVSGIRAEAKTPVTKTDIDKRRRSRRDYYGQDIPLLLRDAPSINTYTEAGVGRLGVLVHHAARHQPDAHQLHARRRPARRLRGHGDVLCGLSRSRALAAEIQVQRGVGTSTVGSPSFGGSINFEIDRARRQSSTDHAEIGAGSFGTQVRDGRHISPARCPAASRSTRGSPRSVGRLSRIVRRTAQRNVFVSAAKQNRRRAAAADRILRPRVDAAVVLRRRPRHAASTNLRANPLAPDGQGQLRLRPRAAAVPPRSRDEHDRVGLLPARLRLVRPAASTASRYGLDGHAPRRHGHGEHVARPGQPRTTACT